jgi:hypothetical protein
MTFCILVVLLVTRFWRLHSSVPDQVQEAYARKAEENQHTHQDSRRGNDQIPVLFRPLYIETNNRQL